MSPRQDAVRARAITARLAAILVEQDAPNFLPSMRTLQDLLGDADTRAGLGAAARLEAAMHGGMGSLDDLVFWPADGAERVAVNDEWTALRAELGRLLERWR